jgi:hypothetical protein
MFTLLLLGLHALTVLVSFPPTPAFCGGPTEFSLARVRSLVTVAHNPSFPGHLKRLANVDPDEIRLLTDERDSRVCRDLRQLTMRDRGPDRITGAPLRVTFYEAGEFYVAVITPQRPPRSPTAPRVVGEQSDARLLVFDHRMNKLVETRG